MGVSLVESTDPNDENIAPTGPDDSFCAYTNNGGSDDTRRKIFFSLALSSNADGAKIAFDTLKNLAVENADAESINDLGDGAYWTPNPGQLVAVKGRYQLVIAIDQPEAEGKKDKAIAAANIIIPRL